MGLWGGDESTSRQTRAQSGSDQCQERSQCPSRPGEILVAHIGQIHTVGVDSIPSRLAARRRERLTAAFDLDGDGLYLPGQVTANISNAKHINSAVH